MNETPLSLMRSGFRLLVVSLVALAGVIAVLVYDAPKGIAGAFIVLMVVCDLRALILLQKFEHNARAQLQQSEPELLQD